MRKILLSLLMLSGCVVGTEATGGADDDGGGDDQPQPQPQPEQRVCSLPGTTADAGALTASKAQQCNQSGSGGLKKWYRVMATLPDTMDYVQIELWDLRGAFSAGPVAVGSYQLTGADLDPNNCGICVRGLGDKGAGTQKEYFATAGQVEVTAVGGGGLPISVTLTNAQFREIDAAKAAVAGGCTASLSRVKLDGTVVVAGGGGGGGGNCPLTIGD